MPKIGVKIPKMPKISTNKYGWRIFACLFHHQRILIRKETHCWCPRLVHWCGDYTFGAAQYQYHINNINIKYFWGTLNINNTRDFGDLDHDDDMMTPSKLP